MQRTIRIVDTSLRDGNQSLWGAAGITTGICETVGPLLEQAGFEAIDFTSSTNLAMGVKFHNENPWERISRMKAVMPNTQLSAISTGMRFMSWDKASEDIMRMSLRLMAKHGVTRLQIAEPMNDADATLKVASWAKQEGFEYIVAATTFTESPVHTDQTYIDNAALFASHPDVDAVYLKDPGGLLSVDRTRELIPALRQAVGEKPLELHSHCTTGEAPQLYVEAAKLGVDVLHTGLGPLSRGTAQPNLHDLLTNLDAAGIPVQLNREPLDEVVEILEDVAKRQDLPAGPPMTYDLRQHQHQIPGGMLGTLKRQLKELKLADRFDDIVAEVGQVRADLGYPIMVTPFSQFVGSQALMNVLSQQAGQERYSTIPDEVIRFVLGQFGTPQGPISDVVRKRIDSLPRARELAEVKEPKTLAEVMADYAKANGTNGSEEDALLRHVLPTEQFKAMQQAGSAPRWNGTGAVSNAADFIAAVQKLPNWRQLTVKLGEEKINLVRTGN